MIPATWPFWVAFFLGACIVVLLGVGMADYLISKWGLKKNGGTHDDTL